jgi:hypothetical protein
MPPDIHEATLSAFEDMRRANGFIPEPTKPSPFLLNNEGTIILYNYPKADDPGTANLHLVMFNRTSNGGPKPFELRGYYPGVNELYKSLTIEQVATFNIQSGLVMKSQPGSSNKKESPELTVKGTMNIHPGASFNMTAGNAMFAEGSRLYIHDGAYFNVNFPSDDNTIHITIEGELELPFDQVDDILYHKNILVDKDVHVLVRNLPTNRYMSITDYVTDLNKSYQNLSTSGVRNLSNSSRVRYVWRAGTPPDMTEILSLFLDYGEAYLGDFHLLLTGMPKVLKEEMQYIADLTIDKKATLLIYQKLENGMTYVLPTLYITNFPGNTKEPGFCRVEGKIIADGKQSSIQLDRNCQLIIEESGEVTIQNSASIQNVNSYEESPILIVNGKLTIDDMSQLQNMSPGNIVFGPKGKLIVLNPVADETERKVLFSIPEGIKTSELYRLFEGRLQYIEWHFRKGNGISIDTTFDSFSKMSWYNHPIAPIELAQAIYEKMIIWDDGAFIEVDNSIAPFVDDTSDLTIVGRFFNTYGTDKEKTQEIAYKLSAVGCGDILFRFSKDSNVREVLMDLTGCNAEKALYHTVVEEFWLYTDSPGSLYYRNNTGGITPKSIMMGKEVIGKPVGKLAILNRYPAPDESKTIIHAKRIDIDESCKVEFHLEDIKSGGE